MTRVPRADLGAEDDLVKLVWKDAQVQRVNAVFLGREKAPARQAPRDRLETKDSVDFPAPPELPVLRDLRDTLVPRARRENQATRDLMDPRASRATEETLGQELMVSLDCLVTLEPKVKEGTRDSVDRMAFLALLVIKGYPEMTGYPAHEVATVFQEGRDRQEPQEETGSREYLERREKLVTRVNQALMDSPVNLVSPDSLDSKETRAMQEGQGFQDSPGGRELRENVAMQDIPVYLDRGETGPRVVVVETMGHLVKKDSKDNPDNRDSLVFLVRRERPESPEKLLVLQRVLRARKDSLDTQDEMDY